MAFGSEPGTWRGGDDDDDGGGQDEPTAVSFRRDRTLWLIFALPEDPGSLELSCFGAWRLWSDGLSELCIVRPDGGVDVALEDPLFLGIEDRQRDESPYEAMRRLGAKLPAWRDKAARTVSKTSPAPIDRRQ